MKFRTTTRQWLVLLMFCVYRCAVGLTPKLQKHSPAAQTYWFPDVHAMCFF